MAIYGLKQGGREWYTCIDEFFKDMLGFTRTFADHSLYIYESGSSVIIVPLYVDDLLIGFKDEQHMLQIKGSLEKRFKMTDAGPASWVLGMCRAWPYSYESVSGDISTGMTWAWCVCQAPGCAWVGTLSQLNTPPASPCPYGTGS